MSVERTARSFLLNAVSKAPKSLSSFLIYCHQQCADEVHIDLYNFSTQTMGLYQYHTQDSDHLMDGEQHNQKRQKCKPARYSIQVFAALLWIIFSRRARDEALRNESEYVRGVFVRHLEEDMIYFLHGMRPDGRQYDESSRNKSVFRRFDLYVYTAISVLRHL